ncbi:MAG: VWA domain-containing protein [Calditrichota bacterium]
MKRTALIILIILQWTHIAAAGLVLTVLKSESNKDQKAAFLISVTDQTGKPVKGLTNADFQVLVSGEKVDSLAVTPVSAGDESVSLILSIDISGSMKGEPFVETQRALNMVLDQLEKKDFISLLSFGTKVAPGRGFTHDKYQIRQAIAKLKAADNYTALYDAVCAAMAQARESLTTQTAVIILTDGKDTGSAQRRQDAVDRAGGASIPIFTLGFGRDIDAPFLQEIAGVSGGRFLSTPDPSAIAGLYEQVLDQLKNQYILTFNFNREPGPYKAYITVTAEGETAQVSKTFFHRVESVLPIIAVDPWWKSFLIFFLGLLLVLVIGLTVWFYVLKPERPPVLDPISTPNLRALSEIVKRLIDSKGKVYLELPEGFTSPDEFIQSKHSADTRILTRLPNAFLKVHGLEEPVPLANDMVAYLPELIIARKTEESQVFRKPDVAYIWMSNNAISRPRGDKPGHARIFAIEGERFAVEDLDSGNGTFLNGQGSPIEGIVPLRDGDRLDIGGRSGLTLIYRESELESEESVRTVLRMTRGEPNV